MKYTYKDLIFEQVSNTQQLKDIEKSYNYQFTYDEFRVLSLAEIGYKTTFTIYKKNILIAVITHFDLRFINTNYTFTIDDYLNIWSWMIDKCSFLYQKELVNEPWYFRYLNTLLQLSRLEKLYLLQKWNFIPQKYFIDAFFEMTINKSTYRILLRMLRNATCFADRIFLVDLAKQYMYKNDLSISIVLKLEKYYEDGI